MLTKPGQSFAPIIGTALLSLASTSSESGIEVLESRAEVKLIGHSQIFYKKKSKKIYKFVLIDGHPCRPTRCWNSHLFQKEHLKYLFSGSYRGKYIFTKYWDFFFNYFWIFSCLAETIFYHLGCDFKYRRYAIVLFGTNWCTDCVLTSSINDLE